VIKVVREEEGTAESQSIVELGTPCRMACASGVNSLILSFAGAKAKSGFNQILSPCIPSALIGVHRRFKKSSLRAWREHELEIRNHPV
jgi:hypothetical protein